MRVGRSVLRTAALILVLAPWLAVPALAVDPLDLPFAHHQFLVHAIGHGTTSGGVADDFYTLLNEAPDANGHYTIPDGNGGTFGYNSDYHAGPFQTPREVCAAAAAKGIPNQTWTVAYDYNTTFDCAAAYGPTVGPSEPAGVGSGPSLTCDATSVVAGGSTTCTATIANPAGAALEWVWYVDGTQLAGSGPSQQITGLAAGSHEVEVVAVIAGEPFGPGHATITAGDGGANGDQNGLPVPVLVALAALAAALVAAALAWQRGRGQQVKNACDELAARYRAMVEARARRAAGLAQGVAALGRAYVAEVDANAAREAVASERTQAIALLGSAGAIGAAVLATSAGALDAAAATLRAATAFVAGGSEALLDYLPMTAGGSGPAAGLGQSIVNLISNLGADAQALRGLAGLPAAASIGVVTDALTHGLEHVDEAMAAARSTRQQLEVACETARRDLGELDGQIGAALTQLAACPGGLEGLPADPRAPLRAMPLPPGVPPSG